MVAALAAYLFNHRLLPKRVRAFPPLILLGIVVQLIDEFWPGIGGSRYTIFHIYQFIAFPLFASYFYQAIQYRWVKRLLLVLIPAYYLILLMIFWLVPESWDHYYFPDQQLLGFMVIVMSMILFYQMYQSEEMIDLGRSPDFWLGVANLVYFAGFSLCIGCYWYVAEVLKEPTIAYGILTISKILNLSLYFFYVIAFSCRPKT